MNQTIIELKLSVGSKQEAARIVTLLQRIVDGGKDEAADKEFLQKLRGNTNVLSAAYRERKERE